MSSTGPISHSSIQLSTITMALQYFSYFTGIVHYDLNFALGGCSGGKFDFYGSF